MKKNIKVEVCYSLSDNYFLQQIECPQGVTVAEVIEQSGVLLQFNEIDLAKNKVGVYAQFVELSHEVKDGDRVEIYRELTADPKAIRQIRIAKAEQAKRDAEQTEKAEKAEKAAKNLKTET